MRYALIIFLVFGMNNIVHSQFSGISVAYGKSYQKPLHFGEEYVKSNPFSVEYSQYLHRFWSATAQFQYEGGNYYDQAHLNNPFKIIRVGGTLNYWILNDIRLLGKMARSSCKGKLVAQTFKFRIFLSGGLYGNIMSSPENDFRNTYMSYSAGIGINLYQFSISKFPLEFRMGTKYVIIPYITANYIGGIKRVPLNDVHNLKIEKLEFKLGLKFGFAG